MQVLHMLMIWTGQYWTGKEPAEALIPVPEFCQGRLEYHTRERPLPEPSSPGRFLVSAGEPWAGGTQAPAAEEGSQRLDRRACVRLSGGGSFFGVETGA